MGSRVSIVSRRERLLLQPYTADPRASLPRPLRRAVSPAACLAGVPPELRDRIGRNLQGTAFPYPQFLQGTGALCARELEVVELENARWQVVVCPALGGRILRVFDRPAGRELLLQPPVLQQGVVGLAGAWFVGGVEFNAFRFGHNIHGESAIACRRVRLPNGDAAVVFGATDELFGCRWQVTLALGQTQVLLRVELRNESREPQPDHWWTTIAVPAHRDTRILAAPGPVLHHGMFRLGYEHHTWPRLHGRDWSRWLEHHEIASAYLYDPASDVFGCVDAADGFGFVHLADRSICRGRKLWSIGAGRDNGIWSDRLLEPAMPSYLELQSGRHPTQVECGRLEPGEVRAWTESVGSIVLPGSTDDGDYAAWFAHYEQAALAAMGLEYSQRGDAATWLATAEEPATPAAPRVELSRRIISAPATVTPEEVAAVTREGWVGGAAWIQKLGALAGAGRLDAAGRLAAAAARFDRGDVDALTELGALAAGEDASAGWASLLLGIHTRDPQRLACATELLPERVETWLARDELLAERGRHEERARLWRHLPPELAGRDDVRVARAAGALARGEWREARQQLLAPLPTIAEGSPTPWLVFREAFVAEALEEWAAGRVDTALPALFAAGQPAPQFGVGRDEAGWSGDLLYYRWRLAMDAGRMLDAALVRAIALEARPYVGSVAAAYVGRVAHESAHATAPARLDALRRWDEDAGDAARELLPVRAAVLERMVHGTRAGWERLRDHPLYRHRARFETQLRELPGR